MKWVLLLGKLLMLVLVQALRLPMLLQLLLGCCVLLGHSGAGSLPARGLTAWGGASLLPAPVHEGCFAVVSEVQAEAPLRLGQATPLTLAPCGHCKCPSYGQSCWSQHHGSCCSVVAGPLCCCSPIAAKVLKQRLTDARPLEQRFRALGARSDSVGPLILSFEDGAQFGEERIARSKVLCCM